MSRKQSFIANDGYEVLLDGSKSCWKTRTNLDILIASHPKSMCIEVVAYNSEIGVEAPRLYVNSIVLSSQFNTETGDFQEKISARKEVLNRQKKTVNIAELTKQVYNELMVNYLMQRLNVVTEDIDPTKQLRVMLTPIAGDDTELDIIVKMPVTVLPVTVTYTKKASTSEILRAQHVLNAEREQLQHAMRLAELSSMASDNFKLMIEEKRKLAKAMKCLSPARLRWIKAINQVLIRNYIEAVKTRLLKSNISSWYKACIASAKASDDAEAEVLRLAQDRSEKKLLVNLVEAPVPYSLSLKISSSSGKGRDKKARRSMDNSELPGLVSRPDSPSNQRLSPSKNSESLPMLGSPSQKVDKLLLDPMERRRQAKIEKDTKAGKLVGGKSLSRKSFNGETDFEKLGKMEITEPNDKPPTLLDSYSEKIPRVKEITLTPNTGSSSIKLVRRPRN
ncbi:hypothetical protein B484DRAFT_134821 [Ochromonadaceae sp. CCMP2298]|nr:hypothetical protein B484DRAFT_134821 [Ochromonadaceae sp. CCMP2298]|mmetsp:Transcript_2109/g.4996  ORF Transcript_2109/g.4996 Transcript_2109/m.4996 type:complete len:449 (+) Transcript_2109:82-1428(+)